MFYLSHQHTHVLATGKRGGNDRREINAIASNLLNVKLVDQMQHLISCADYPDLRFIAMRNWQQSVELCSHHYYPSLMLG